MLDNNVVTLKMNGKAYTCEGRVDVEGRKRRCKGKEFFNLGTWDNADFNTPPDEVRFKCITCNLVVDRRERVLEEQLPPRNDWRTPQLLWETLNREYHFNLDVAADATNAKCAAYFDGLTPESDALLRNWFDTTLLPSAVSVWDNPPYSPVGTVGIWLQKGLEQAALGVRSVHLVPMSSSVAWFNDLVVPYAEWHSFRGRIPFEDPLAAPGDERTSPKQDNLLVIYRPDSTIVGHTAVRDARTGERLWTRPDLLQATARSTQ